MDSLLAKCHRFNILTDLQQKTNNFNSINCTLRNADRNVRLSYSTKIFVIPR